MALLSFSNEIRDVPNGKEEANISVWDREKDNYEHLDRTTTWNFQQGARLQWMPSQADKLIYNVSDGRQARARLLDVNTGKSQDFDIAISAVSPSGKRALAPSFARLGAIWCAYGYQGVRGASIDDVAPTNDGIWEIDLESGHTKLLLSISELDDIAKRAAPKESFRFVTHPSYSPSGNRVIFLERYFIPGGALYTRMYVGQPDKRDWSLILEEMVSHFDWYDDDTILVWSRHAPRGLKHSREDGLLASRSVRALLSVVRPLLMPITKSVFREYYAYVSVSHPQQIEPFAVDLLKSDGHPMFRPDRKWLVTDSYPDKRGRQHLYLVDMESQVVFEIGQFDADTTLPSDIKCDLHPRWNRSGTKIAIDTAINGDRQVMIVDVEHLVRTKRSGQSPAASRAT